MEGKGKEGEDVGEVWSKRGKNGWVCGGDSSVAIDVFCGNG